jgi:NADPH:quinone reductase-like Zn-dependent oxidoreductase
MKAVCLEEFGRPEVLVAADAPDPELSPRTLWPRRQQADCGR